jgi:hypothetical protein
LLETVSCPFAELAVVGLKRTVRTIPCPGFRVAGKPPPETENPAPVTESELIVTGTEPLEVTVTDFATAVPTDTFPNGREVALKVIAGTAAGESVIWNVLEIPPACAVIVAICGVVTELMVALKPVLVAPDLTVTPLTTCTARLLLVKVT